MHLSAHTRERTRVACTASVRPHSQGGPASTSLQHRGEVNMLGLRRLGGGGLLLALGTVMVACGGSTTTTTTSSAKGPSGITVASFDSSFSAMGKFKSLAAAGKGMVGVILPDVNTSVRYAAFDTPYLTKAFQAAGFSKFKIDNAHFS